jgi:hypothetical protein
MPLHIFLCDDWFDYKRKGFRTLFENCFEILEKEKKMEIFFFSIFWHEGLLSSLLSPAPSLLILSSAQSKGAQLLSSTARRTLGRPNMPKPKAASPFSLSLWLTSGARRRLPPLARVRARYRRWSPMQP